MDRMMQQMTVTGGYTLEYSIVGSGEPVLVFHGGHSNCKETLGYSEMTEKGYRLITPSRPGYGATSIELGEELDDACDAYVKLMDELGLASAHLLAVSAGGPSGIRFAARYPERTKSLILQSAVTRHWLGTEDRAYKFSKRMFRPGSEKYTWALVRGFGAYFPRVLFKSMISSFSLLPSNEVRRRLGDDDVSLFLQMINLQRSGQGFMLDLREAMNDRDTELAQIRCPVLVMHSRHDATVSIEHARHIARHVPHASVCELDAWGHLIWLGQDATAMYEELFAFLGKQEGAAT
ncbi:alpha/beta hydrolase [Paenibacillus sp. 1011MAR3C5]|uniref:alpha/beta fold hydrolase n=1 Tax=Paenibacillus sp. 1011MAR3C5 TaxID=1675787 RepID=UPI000E6C25D3|nr:alpha/beta hydrolase [Paenibacillus sp. 1011MAR3C5]RJE89633.1 alpha/beta hydrolase [Paenibacillus sp. 1011MAR3C5]